MDDCDSSRSKHASIPGAQRISVPASFHLLQTGWRYVGMPRQVGALLGRVRFPPSDIDGSDTVSASAAGSGASVFFPHRKTCDRGNRAPGGRVQRDSCRRVSAETGHGREDSQCAHRAGWAGTSAAQIGRVRVTHHNILASVRCTHPTCCIAVFRQSLAPRGPGPASRVYSAREPR